MIEVKSARSCDAGDWKCVVTNFEGSVSISTCYVDIESEFFSLFSSFSKILVLKSISVPNNFRKPRFMEPLRAVLTDEGLVSFECKVVGKWKIKF